MGFTGTQRGMTKFQKEHLVQILKLKQCSEFVHGDCIGSDAEANDVAFDCGIRIFTIFPAHGVNTKKRAYCFIPDRKDRVRAIWHEIIYKGETIRVRWMTPDMPLARNKHIVDNVAWMIATPKEHTHTLRSGTWATIRYAWKTKRDITIIPPIVRDEDEKIIAENN